MENKARTLQSVTKQFIASSREFFALETPTVSMPLNQRQMFITQAFKNHYRVALFFANETEPFVGHLTHALSAERYVVQAYRSNVSRVVDATQLTFIKKLA